ncbi:hypothetical protein RM780_11115 [Streptomyces sp. DSM 44917]|uniref:Uncharacterized protein n=1 Tax=Streptomyces boetiae TaxID=3075541 RepID=A0ABU2L7F5_9ACTN|nr:hypothetical protein [Streptomyces sp. DSM 44917]MDT0307510.1 hypothetical protein [Streptomyces sp. DSM 44917]
MEQAAFPADLLRHQREWYRTYQALAAASHPLAYTALRRRLTWLSARIAYHPYWSQRRPAARADLSALARAA